MDNESYNTSLHAFRKEVLEAARKVRLTQLRSGISHEQLVPLASYAPWRDDLDFLSLYQEIKEHTLVDLYRCYELWDLARQARQLDGDVLEVGVWRGGTAAILAKAVAGPRACHLWLADTFEGVAKAGPEDTRYVGREHADTSIEHVTGLLAKLGAASFTILRGTFPEESGERISRNNFKMCHVDVDTYQSAMDVFAWVWPRLVIGGVVVFDDYGFWGCEGVTAAVNQLKSRHTAIYNLNGHALVYRTA